MDVHRHKPRTPLSQGVLSKDLSYRCESGYMTQDLLQQVTNVHDEERTFDIDSSPRQNTPAKSNLQQPSLKQQLSLSDNEETPPINKSMTALNRDVVVIESHDFQQATGEVETRSFTMKSPARVVCHSPSPDKRPTQRRVTPNNNKSLPNKAVSTDGKKKKKTYVVVQSKYKNISTKKDETKSRHLDVSAIPHHTNVTGSNHKTKKTQVTSTPFLANSLNDGHQITYDGSILDQTKFQQNNEPNIKKPLGKKPLAATKSKRDLKTKDKSGSNKSSESDQLKIDLTYARYLQQVYLEMKARQTFSKQEENAKQQLFSLWAANRKLEKEIEALTLSIETQKLHMCIDQLLKTQIEGLRPLAEKIGPVCAKSKKLSASFKNISHYLPTEAIIQPKEDELTDALNESRILLAEISSVIRENQPQISEVATTLCDLKSNVESELHQQKRCAELLSACKSLVNRERSYQVQLMDSR